MSFASNATRSGCVLMQSDQVLRCSKTEKTKTKTKKKKKKNEERDHDQTARTHFSNAFPVIKTSQSNQ